MVYRRRRSKTRTISGYFQFENTFRRTLSGFGDCEFIRLRDEHGNLWRGTAEVQDDDSVYYRFRDGNGKVISGISDRHGILLRDDKGKSWRGYVY